MPNAPRSRCIEPLCPGFAVQKGRCPEHAKEWNVESHPRAALYRSKKWRTLRLQVLRRDGYVCQDCGLAMAKQVDHRVPVSAGGAVYDPANLQSLCAACHSRKTLKETRG